ncbi:MAG: DNA polymerase ligase N-terminal domain-containing protein [Nitrospirota bacterium]
MPIFVIHEHHSRKLHFDLRLEIEGVLKSWAVPKGPSMNPKEKRLCVMVDDHALEYATFEGEIPEGMYGAGTVAIWDKGTFEVRGGSLEKGKLDLVFFGRKLKGEFALVRMTGRENDWLLMKKTDGFADYKFELKMVLGERKK